MACPRIFASGWFLALAIALLLQPATAVGEEAAPADAYRLVFFGPTRPVVIGLQIHVDGEEIDAARRAYLERLFQSLDQDEDGSLNEAEAARIPSPDRLGRGAPGGSFDWRQIDRRPEDGVVSKDELFEYVTQALGGPLEFVEKPLRSVQAIDFFGILDRDGDGRISTDERDSIQHALRKLDLDRDETYNIDELNSFRNPEALNAAMVQRDPTEIPFQMPTDARSMKVIVDKLHQRYGSARERGLGPAELGVRPSKLAPFDEDSDGRLDDAELEQFVRKCVPEVRLIAELPNRRPGVPRLAAVANPSEATDPPAGSRKLDIELGGVPLEMRAIRPPTTAYDSRQFYRLRFRTADSDKNKYLDRQEFAALNLPGATFDAVDADGDGMVLEKEITDYIDGKSGAAENRAVMTISREGESLFEILDTDRDRRLGPRELLEAPRRLATIDADRNGVIVESEIVGSYRLTFEISRGGLLATAQAAPMAGSTAPVLLGSTSGPTWFRKMDVNQDGEVSLREFLGPQAAFEKLDADADGFITPDEAGAVE